MLRISRQNIDMVNAYGMELTEDQSFPNQLLFDRIAELEFNQSQLRDKETELSNLLDTADEDITTLRLENISLRKQVQVLERIINDSKQDEPEPNRFFMTECFEAKKSSESRIHELEKESNLMKEHNKKLLGEIKNLEQQRQEDKNNLSKLKTEIQCLEGDMEEAQISLQSSAYIIDEKNHELQRLEGIVQEYSDVIEGLREAKHKLLIELEDKEDEASYAIQTEMLAERDGFYGPPMSLAEEMQLISPIYETKSTMTDPVSFKNEEDEIELKHVPSILTNAALTKSWRLESTFRTEFQNAGFLLFGFLCLCLFGVVILGCAGTLYSLTNLLWTSVRLMVQPCFSVQYRSLPPF